VENTVMWSRDSDFTQVVVAKDNLCVSITLLEDMDRSRRYTQFQSVRSLGG